MIKYALRCDGDHAFESWFRDSAAFDQLSEAHGLACPDCGSAVVSKALMAPALGKGHRPPTLPQAAAEASSVEQPVALIDDRAQDVRRTMRELHRKLTEGADDVGRAFAEEARRIHEGEVPHRSIYGQASGADVRSLLEDGIPLMPLPSLPDEHH